MNEPFPEAPFLLAAAPDLQDPNFRRTVVLVISHDADGTFGLVLNHPLNKRLSDLMPDIEGPAAGIQMFRGGPVQEARAQFLVDAAMGGREMVPGLAMLGDTESNMTLEDLLASLPAGDHVRGYLGHAGWGVEQLQGELAEGSWLVAELDVRHVFEISPEALWRRVLWDLGGPNRWAALDDIDPAQN